MQNFTGSHKKSIAGSRCALGILLLCASLSIPVIASDVSPANIPANTTQVSSSASVNAPAESAPANPEILATPLAAAQTTSPVNTPKIAPQKINSSSQLANLIGGLALILVLIYGLSWFVKRFTQGGFMHNPTMKVVSSMPLGTRERLMLVDVGGKQLLLGVTAAQVNTLHVFDEPVVKAEKNQLEKSQTASSEFSQKLMAILQQKNLSSPDDGSQKKSNS